LRIDGTKEWQFFGQSKAGSLIMRLLTLFALLRRSCGFVLFVRFLVVLSPWTPGGYIDSVLIEY
jgi:hypothetical protein